MSKLNDLVANCLMIPAEKAVDDLKYNSIAEWDLVAHMTLVAEIEDTYDIMLDTDDIVEMSSIGRIREILGKYDVQA